ncbi:GNAT family N-acetyltransferase [Sphingobacterium paucimobilis]|nr:GNAT family N-acetyltransferase [Sphingobacterium paucimobilis]
MDCKELSGVICDYWKKLFCGMTVYQRPNLKLTVKESLSEEEGLMVLDFPTGVKHIVVSRALLNDLENEDLRNYSYEDIIESLRKRGIVLHGADYLYYFSKEALSALDGYVVVPEIRQLTVADTSCFLEFERTASIQDLDDASVSLEHWLVFGAFENDKLVAVASMYPWDDESRIADLGILTLAEYRGRGYALRVAQAICKEALRKGYEPQYRCQLDNDASIALASKLNLTLFAKWDVIAPDIASI